QNYPNPFNPVTNIGFRIVDFGFVTITVFDVTGKEITKLINTDLKAGEYNIDWNASAYSSGVYFYKLTVTAGREVFTDTKKMVLIK
ncbi:MAG: T9SS type A sorting domain-containing protein, partial [Ignavibacteria bacterium]|nr:T9SS type A sorting domain-containing protein [Ignavibacteria bacterium]